MDRRGFLSEIHGHEEAREQLRRLLEADRIPNGILLTGEEGIGKRTVALAFARAVLAGDARGDVDPASPAARKFAAGTYADLEIVERDEAKRFLVIERVRELQEAFALKPVESSRRVGILVDAERLTGEAGNALLKLLEEPPPGSHLILTARDRGAILETLVSRCRWIPLRPLPRTSVAAFLAARGVAPERVPLLAAAAEGRPGVAARMADEAFEETVLAPALALLDETGEPVGRAADVASALREGAKNLEEARERLRPVLRCAIFLLRSAVKAGCGAASGADNLSFLPEGWPGRLGALPPATAERRIGRVVRALQDLDLNVSLEPVLEHLRLELAAS